MTGSRDQGWWTCLWLGLHPLADAQKIVERMKRVPGLKWAIKKIGNKPGVGVYSWVVKVGRL